MKHFRAWASISIAFFVNFDNFTIVRSGVKVQTFFVPGFFVEGTTWGPIQCFILLGAGLLRVLTSFITCSIRS